MEGRTGQWETVIGLEVHAQVVSKAKLFSGAATEFGAEPFEETNRVLELAASNGDLDHQIQRLCNGVCILFIRRRGVHQTSQQSLGLVEIVGVIGGQETISQLKLSGRARSRDRSEQTDKSA